MVTKKIILSALLAGGLLGTFQAKAMNPVWEELAGEIERILALPDSEEKKITLQAKLKSYEEKMLEIHQECAKSIEKVKRSLHQQRSLRQQAQQSEERQAREAVPEDALGDDAESLSGLRRRVVNRKLLELREY